MTYDAINITFGTSGFTSNVIRNYDEPYSFGIKIEIDPSIEALMEYSGRGRWEVMCLLRDMKRTKKRKARMRLAWMLNYPTLDNVYDYVKTQTRRAA